MAFILYTLYTQDDNVLAVTKMTDYSLAETGGTIAGNILPEIRMTRITDCFFR